MIDWIERLPDWMIGTVTASAAWVGFNYVVLADRAMERDHAQIVAPRCMQAVTRSDPVSRLPPIPKTGTDLDIIIEMTIPKPLSEKEKIEACDCALRVSRSKLRFDYAIHLASFRMIEVDAASSFAESAIASAVEGSCRAVRTLT